MDFLPKDVPYVLSDNTVLNLHGVDATFRQASAGHVEFFVRSGGRLPVAWISWITDKLVSHVHTLNRSGWYMFNANLGIVLERTEIVMREKHYHPKGA